MRVSLIIFIIGFITIAPSIYVGIKYFDGKVTDQPYETGLMYDEDKKFISDNGLALDQINVSRIDKNVEIKFELTKKSGVKLDELQFFVSRPATNQNSIEISAENISDSLFKAGFSIDSVGHHILLAKSRVNGKEVSLQKSFYIN